MSESCVPAEMAAPPAKAVRFRRRPPLGRAGGLAATVAGLALLGAAAGCSSGGSGSGNGTSGSKAASPAMGIRLPAKIASLKSPGEDKTAFKDEGIPSSVVRNLHAANYYDAADSSHSVTVEGGPGLPLPSDGPADKVKRLMSRWLVDADTAHPVTVSSGSGGGTAECFPSAANPKSLDCGWVSGKVAVTLSFDGYGQSRIRALVPQIISAIAQP